MKLYVTLTSPYARLARILVVEKKLQDRVEIVEAETRQVDSPYYEINPSGRVPYFVDDEMGWTATLGCGTRWMTQIGLIAGLRRLHATCATVFPYGCAR